MYLLAMRPATDLFFSPQYAIQGLSCGSFALLEYGYAKSLAAESFD